MKILTPLQKKFALYGKMIVITQLFGENKNRLFYGPDGHQGIDFRTTGDWKYKGEGLSLIDGKWSGYFVRIPLDKYEQKGHRPVVASHDGVLNYILLPDRRDGWGVTCTAEVEKEGDLTVQYRTLYWHIDSPWSGAKYFKGIINTLVKKTYARAGTVIAMNGNTGYPKYSTAPHLHFELQKRKQVAGKWTGWERIDPMPYFYDKYLVYKYGERYFYQGTEITKDKANLIMAEWPKVK